MNEDYQIYQIAREENPIPRENDDESINKAWYNIDGLGACLFKSATTTPGSLTEYRTDWSEKVVERLANILGLPTAQYEFATAYLNGSPELIEGVISVDCIPTDADISSGGFFLRQTFDNKLSRKYNIDNIINALNIRSVKPPRNWKQQIPEIDTGAKLFVGYLMLDALVQNEDRHGSNWAVMSIEGELELTLSFDHGVSLGSRNSYDDKLSRSVLEHTNELSFSHFKELERPGIVSVFNVFKRATELEPVATKIWLDKLALIDSNKIDEIFKLIPEQRITQTAANFAKLLLLENLKKIRLEIAEIIASRELLKLSDLKLSDDSPEPPNDSPEPPEPPNPRNPPNSPKPSTPPSSPDSTNSPDPPSSPNSSQSRPTDGDTAGIASLNIDTVQPKSQHLTDQQHEKQIMTNLEGFHGNAQNQVSTNAGDISKLAEQLGQALGLLGAESGAKVGKETIKAGKETIKAFMKLWKALNKEQEQAEENSKSNNSIIAKSLADRKNGLKESKQRLVSETREFRRDARKHAIKVGLDYIVSLLTNVKKFLKDVWETPGKFFRGIKNKFTSLKDFMLQETKGDVKIGKELSGSKQEQAEKFIKLLNTPAGEQAPEGLENTIIAPWGENLITVDAENNVTANFIQPLMDNEFIQLAMNKNVVAAAAAPNIQPVPNSLASHELNLHGQLIGQDAIDQLLQKVQDTQLSKSTIQELEAVISEPAQVQVTAPIEPVQTQVAAPVEPLPAVEIEAKAATVAEELIEDPFKQPETQSVVITKAQLEDLSDDRSQDLKDVIYTDLGKNDEFGSRFEKMQAVADKFITNDEYAALEQFETTNVQALVQRLEANITAEEVNIPEFAQYLAENPNSLPQDQEADLKSIQVRTEKLADAKALLTFIETKYPAQQATDTVEQPKYKLIDMSLSELTVERNAEIKTAIIPHNSALTAETRQENLDRVLADPKYAEIQSSAAETVLTTIQDNTERLEHNRAENLARIARKNTELTGIQQLANQEKIEDPNQQDQIGELTQTVDKLTKFDEYHHQELATLAQLTAAIQRPNLKPVAIELPEPPQVPQLPKSPASVATGASKPLLDNSQRSPRTDFVAIVVTPKLASELVTIAQLHQIGTSADNSSLTLLTSNEDRDLLSIAHTAQANGSQSYQVVDAGKEFNFTVTSEQIVTNFNIGRNNDLSQVRNLVTSIANVVKDPEQTNLKPHPDTDTQRIETVQKLNDLLDQTIDEPNLPAKSVVTLDGEKFGVRLDRDNRKVIITDKTTLASVTLSKNGVEDSGLLKKITEVAKDKSNSLAQRLARVVVEKTNAAKTAMENAAPNIMVALDERATADRATAQKVSKAVNRLGTQVDSFIGQGIRNAAATPGMFGAVRQMKKIEQVGDATENQVQDNLQSVGEHSSETPDNLQPVSEHLNEAPVAENRGLLTASEREQLERDFNSVVVHKAKAPASGHANQPTH